MKPPLWKHLPAALRRILAAGKHRGPPAAPVDEILVRRGLRDHCRPPRHYYIDIGNYCNLRCPFCVTGAKEQTMPQGFMSVDNFARIIDKIRPFAELIGLYNWGEPFLNPRVFQIIRTAAVHGIKVHIDSNLSFRDFDDAYVDAVIDSGLYSLFASIDGVSQESYQTYRVGGNAARVFANLEKLIRAKKRRGAAHPILGWQFHVSRFNEHEMAAAAAKAAELQIGIVFKRLSSPPSWWSSMHHQAAMILKGAEWFNRTYTPPPNPDLALIRLHPNVSGPCAQLFGTMVIAWNGDVLPCTCVEGNEYVMGNLLEQTLEAVWNGPQFRRSREFVLNYGPEQHTGSVCERLTCPVTDKQLPSQPEAAVAGRRPLVVVGP